MLFGIADSIPQCFPSVVSDVYHEGKDEELQPMWMWLSDNLLPPFFLIEQNAKSMSFLS